jgi:hypothetical protein
VLELVVNTGLPAALRCGWRFGKTDFGKTWIIQGHAQGEECAWFAPQHKTWSEVYDRVDLTSNW